MLCHVDERESTNRATGSFVKNAVFEIANLPGDIWLHQCMALLKVHSLHLWRDKSKAALSALMPFIQWVDVLQTVAYDNGAEEAHGNSEIYLGSPHSDGSGPFPAAPDITVQSQQFGNKMLDA